MTQFEQFQNEISDHIREHLPEKYRESGLAFLKQTKVNDIEVNVLLISGGENEPAPYIPVDGYFNDYLNGRDMDDILESIARTRVEAAELSAVTPEMVPALHDFARVRDAITARTVGLERNAAALQDRPHTDMGDFAFIYQVEGEGIGAKKDLTVPVTGSMLEHFGISKEELHKIAMKNTERMFPVIIKTIAEMLGIPEGMGPSDAPMYVITNKAQTYGAVAMFYPDTFQEIEDRIGPFFALPSSLHEFIAIPQGQGDALELAKMVQQINRMEVSPKDQLSDHVYAAEGGMLQRADIEEAARTQNGPKGRENSRKGSVIGRLESVPVPERNRRVAAKRSVHQER